MGRHNHFDKTGADKSFGKFMLLIGGCLLFGLILLGSAVFAFSGR